MPVMRKGINNALLRLRNARMNEAKIGVEERKAIAEHFSAVNQAHLAPDWQKYTKVIWEGKLKKLKVAEKSTMQAKSAVKNALRLRKLPVVAQYRKLVAAKGKSKSNVKRIWNAGKSKGI